MKKEKIITSLSILWLCLNLMRYNLFGNKDTFYIWIIGDMLSWMMVAVIVLLLSKSEILNTIFLFTFTLMVSPLWNALSHDMDVPTISELYILILAFIVAGVYNYKLIIEKAIELWKITRHFLTVVKERIQERMQYRGK